MLVEKYMVAAIKYENEYVKKISLNSDNNDQYGYTSDFNLNLKLNVEKDYDNKLFLREEKEFKSKQKAMEYIDLIRFELTHVRCWTIIPIIVDITDLKEIRAYKLNKILKNSF